MKNSDDAELVGELAFQLIMLEKEIENLKTENRNLKIQAEKEQQKPGKSKKF